MCIRDRVQTERLIGKDLKSFSSPFKASTSFTTYDEHLEREHIHYLTDVPLDVAVRDVYKRQGKKWLTTAVPICLAVTCAIGYITVKPYYMYGVKTVSYTHRV